MFSAIMLSMFTAFMMIVIAGKFMAITSINDELESNINNTTITEQVCAVSNNSKNMVELEQRCFLSCCEVRDTKIIYSCYSLLMTRTISDSTVI